MQTLFKELIKDIYKLVKGKTTLVSKLKNLNPDQAYLTASNVEKVKTIWQIDKDVSLKEFYHPTKIRVEDKKIQLDSLDELPENGKVVIQGTAGQGKSILLRYLTGTELVKSHRLPIFVELRKISNSKSLTNLIIDNLSEMGLAIDSTELPHLFDTGKCVLLLDAFDEIPAAQTSAVITLIEGLCNKHHNLCIVVTSRPGADIQKVTYMRVFEMAKLMPSDFEPLLSRLFPASSPKVQEILKAIDASETQIKDLITTPLLLTLLVIVYKSHNNIPKSLAEFYEKLFDILSFRHDSSKPGYNREFATQLSEPELAKLFNAFCFFCMKAQKTSINKTAALNLVTEAKQYLGKDDVNEQFFLNDITKVTCLLIEEGFEYHFIHKSIREFHAANFIERSPEALKSAFYSHAIEQYDSFAAELAFLAVIDDYSYKKMFLLPYIDNLLTIKQCDSTTKISSLSVHELLNGYNLSFAIDIETSTFLNTGISYGDNSEMQDPIYHSTGNAFNLIISNINSLFDDKIETEKLIKKFVKSIPKNKPEKLEVSMPIADFIQKMGIEMLIINKHSQSLVKAYNDKMTLQKSIKEKENRMNSIRF